MRIQRLWIENYKNLHDTEVKFNVDNFINVILGSNTSGKTTLIEALICIFRHLENGDEPPFAYSIDYIFREYQVHIKANPLSKKQLDISCGDSQFSLEDIQITPEERLNIEKHDNIDERNDLEKLKEKNRRTFLPVRVFGYYSGSSNRLQKLFTENLRVYKNSILRGEELLPRFFYAQPFHGQLALLALFLKEDSQLLIDEPHISTNVFLQKYLSISALDSVLLILKEPLGWPYRENKPAFWTREGRIYKLLRALYEQSIAPLRFQLPLDITRENSPKRYYLYRYLTDDALIELSKLYTTQLEFFIGLDSLYTLGFIHDLRIKVRSDSHPNLIFQYGQLSEGEQQLLMVVGLLRFMNQREAIFLLDEPDTHLNPKWAINYVQMLREIVSGDSTSQIIMTTHNPLIVNGLKADQVQVLNKTSDNRLLAQNPEESPIGHSIDRILTGDMFGLESSLDVTTQEKIYERRTLAYSNDQLSLAQQQRLAELNIELRYIDSTLMIPDKIYQEFARRIIQESPALLEPQLDEEKRSNRQERIAKIFREVRKEENDEIH